MPTGQKNGGALWPTHVWRPEQSQLHPEPRVHHWEKRNSPEVALRQKIPHREGKPCCRSLIGLDMYSAHTGEGRNQVRPECGLEWGRPVQVLGLLSRNTREKQSPGLAHPNYKGSMPHHRWGFSVPRAVFLSGGVESKYTSFAGAIQVQTQDEDSGLFWYPHHIASSLPICLILPRYNSGTSGDRLCFEEPPGLSTGVFGCQLLCQAFCEVLM